MVAAMGVLFGLFFNSAVAAADSAVVPIKMRFAEDQENLTVTTSVGDLFDEKSFLQLSSGVASVIVVRFYVHRKGEIDPIAFALAKIRVVYDHWDEKYWVQLDGPLGGYRASYLKRSEALRAATTFKNFPIAPLSRIAVGPHFLLRMVVELNPLSPELLAEVRRWLTKPAGRGRLDSGATFFGSFVSVFVNPKWAGADRVMKYRSQPFYRVNKARTPPSRPPKQ